MTKRLQAYVSFLNKISPLLISMIFIFCVTHAFSTYLYTSLKGDINFHILSAERFGLPSYIKEKGVESLYSGPIETGWDGQFYYLIANDIFCKKGTENYLDNPSYRYKRVGFSLYSYIISKIFFQDWVSPQFYFITYFILILISQLMLMYIFIHLNMNPVFSLLWSLSVGTLLTLFNALPDAAADSFLIIGMFLYLKQRSNLSIIPFVFAGLSRETHSILPIFLAAAQLLNNNSSHPNKLRVIVSNLKFFIPAIITFFWHLLVSVKLGATSNIVDDGILNMPFVTIIKTIAQTANGVHPILNNLDYIFFEKECLILFLMILCISLARAVILLINFKQQNAFSIAIAMFTISLATLFLSLGPTVIKHYTGYMKVFSIFFILTVIIFKNTTARFVNYFLLIQLFLISNYYNWISRINPY